MASVYILYSKSRNKYYVGSCNDLEERLRQHSEAIFPGSYTSNSKDWTLFFTINDLEYEQARNIEKHIKSMKTRKYFNDLKQYPEISEKLRMKYASGSSR